jgi:hypothetical protein
MIKGLKRVTHPQKCRGNRGRMVSQQVHLKKKGVISQKSEKKLGEIDQKCPKMRKKIIEGQKRVTYLQKRRGNRRRRVLQHVHLKKTGVISGKSEKIRENGQKIGQKIEIKLFKGKTGSHTC